MICIQIAVAFYFINFHTDFQLILKSKANGSFQLFLMPSVAFLVTLIIATASQLPEIFPTQENHPSSPENSTSDQQLKIISRVNMAITIFFTWLHFAIINDFKNPSEVILMSQVSFALGILMIGIGLTTAPIERNFAIGFRTPWTLRNPQNWRKTHHFAARVFLFFGILNLSINLLLQYFQLNEIYFISLPAALIIIASLIVYFYSYFIYREKLD